MMYNFAHAYCHNIVDNQVRQRSHQYGNENMEYNNTSLRLPI
jgi:hypothetical protein